MQVGKLYKVKFKTLSMMHMGDIVMFLGDNAPISTWHETSPGKYVYYTFLLADGTVDSWFFANDAILKDLFEPCK